MLQRSTGFVAISITYAPVKKQQQQQQKKTKNMYIWINDIEVYTIEIITISRRMTLHGDCYNVRCDIWVKYEKQVFAIYFLQRHAN